MTVCKQLARDGEFPAQALRQDAGQLYAVGGLTILLRPQKWQLVTKRDMHIHSESGRSG